MKGWVGLVGWPIADGLPTLVVTHQLQIYNKNKSDFTLKIVGKIFQTQHYRIATVLYIFVKTLFCWPPVCSFASFIAFGYLYLISFQYCPSLMANERHLSIEIRSPSRRDSARRSGGFPWSYNYSSMGGTVSSPSVKALTQLTAFLSWVKAWAELVLWRCLLGCWLPAYYSVFTARCYASAVLAMALCPSVRLSVRPSVRPSTKTAKRRITQTTPHDSPRTLVFWRQRFPRNSTGVNLRWRQMQVGWVKISDVLQINGYISKTV